MVKARSASVEWFVLEDSKRPVGTFVPGVVPLLPLPEHAGPQSFWSDERRRRVPRYPPHPSHGAGSSDAEGQAALADAEPEEPNEGDIGEALDPAEELLAELDDLAELAEAFVEDDGFGGGLLPGVGPRGAGAKESGESPAVPQVQEVVPPLAELAHVEQPQQAKRPRRDAELTYYVPGGSISFYRSKMAFQAVCDCPAHGRCVLTRSCNARGRGPGGQAFGGRPVGFLAAWLGRGEHCEDKTEHWLPMSFLAPHEVRAELRAAVVGTPSGVRLLSFERPLEEGESAEPLTLDGYVDAR